MKILRKVHSTITGINLTGTKKISDGEVGYWPNSVKTVVPTAARRCPA